MLKLLNEIELIKVLLKLAERKELVLVYFERLPWN